MNDALEGDSFTFFHPLRVRWSEVDPQGIVFNPNYLVFADIAVTEYFRALGMVYPDAFLALGVDNFAVAASLTFKDAARFDDELDIGMRAKRLGRTSFCMAFSVRRSGAVMAEGEIVYVIGDKQTRRPQPLPESFVASILRFEKTAPDRPA